MVNAISELPIPMTHQLGMVNQASLANKVIALADSYQALSFSDSEQVGLAASDTLRRIIKQAVQSSAFWRSRFQGVDLSVQSMESLLGQFKPMTKTYLREQGQFMSYVTPGDSIENYFTSATSGSTGEPVMVRKSHTNFSIHSIAIQLVDLRFQERDVSKNIALFRRDDGGGKYSGRGFPATELGKTGMKTQIGFHKHSPDEMLDRLEKEEFGQISIHASLLRELAVKSLNEGRNIQFDEAMNWAEPVDENLRELVREAFGARISDRYSSEEAGAIALQCPKHNHLHAMQLSNYVEILDDSGEPVKPGEVGKVHITCLANPNMPLIRYELGDMVSWGECDYIKGLPVIEPKIVRVRDAIWDSSGSLFTGGWGFPTSDLMKDRVFPTQQMVLLSDALVLLHPPRPGKEHVSLEPYRKDLAERMKLDKPLYFWETESLDFLGIWKRRLFIHLRDVSIEDVAGAHDLIERIKTSGYTPNPGLGRIED